MEIDRSKSLQQLEGEDWGDPTFDSHLVTECHRLHRVPLCDFTVEDLRITIGQDIGLEFLVPLALERLAVDPFAEGDYYPCDLLVNVLRAKTEFWRQHPKLGEELMVIADQAIAAFPNMPDLGSQIVEAVTTAHEEFKRETR